MKLLTHNLLQCPLSGTYPLKIVPTNVERTETEFNQEFMVDMLPKLEYAVLFQAAADVGVEGLPETIPEDAAENESFLRILQSVILDTHVTEGELVAECGRRYPITDAIPNMLLAEDEVPGQQTETTADEDGDTMAESETDTSGADS